MYANQRYPRYQQDIDPYEAAFAPLRHVQQNTTDGLQQIAMMQALLDQPRQRELQEQQALAQFLEGISRASDTALSPELLQTILSSQYPQFANMPMAQSPLTNLQAKPDIDPVLYERFKNVDLNMQPQ